ncbi:beta-lactamase [Xanthomonas sp. NCPPB 1128]|uniref:MBL fold metallo-hydrolase n=1 Tax=Xanthomonas sp. NCPPB 1128 TaxID=1775876 RepID=UPI00065AB32E|nr:MBL fold metallo-hydrolase [Xanthomonas sp. NCPPB 1128]KMM77383.1 beta-lactamase [Xanthomonas sp. NCPPB 1128]
MQADHPTTRPTTLTTQLFNPGDKAIFAVSSVLVQGQHDAVLIDAQFSATQARKLVALIQASGKRLITIYISHSDPDFYFGLDIVHSAFPDARIVATPYVAARIEATKDDKLKIWGPQLGKDAPKRLIVPQPLYDNTLSLEDHVLQIVGLEGFSPGRSFVWIPSIRTVAGGVLVSAGQHVWMADTQTLESRAIWLTMLGQIKALAPLQVLPGHIGHALPRGLEAVDFTAGYIRSFENEASKARNSTELIEALKQRYPELGGEGALEISAMVAKKEITWK